MDDKEVVFPEKPERPEEADCCGSGCSPCIFDIYEANLKKWEVKCREIRENPSTKVSDGEERESYLSETQYKPFLVKTIKVHTHNTKIFTFQALLSEAADIESSVEGVNVKRRVEESVTNREALRLRMGQHLIMKGKTSDGSNVSRPYTPIGDRLGEFDILVKLYPDGKMSHYFASLHHGDIAYFRGPYGAFRYCPNDYRRVLMVCAGTGLAPMFTIANGIVSDEQDETFVRLLFCVRTSEDILLRSELRTLAANWNFTAQIHISGSAEPDSRSAARYGENVRYGRLDKDTLGRELGSGDGVLVLVCGTKTFNISMTEHALALGVQKSNIYVF